ncbi:hypothetical protein GJ698_07525 [Pseudoduganella sp. FT26W]|uniref:Histidine kinase domain-containing protein n=1 Tax=Duganella aquatilis TaxID=2666082 RepID=A0A844D2E0_9BURK|nr:sensor histidine kinase [Duganella aquatilis]MRW83945.1 hypothetical protein [Duganella aquatilis]
MILSARAFVLAVLTACWAASASAAAAKGPDLADYNRTQWTAAEGAPPGVVGMAQTADGWLWFGTADGLYRFDGLQFSRYRLPPRLGLNRDRINMLRAAPNGDLYITYYAEGFSVLHPDGRLEALPPAPAARNGIGAVIVDGDNSLWIFAGNIQHFKDGHWTVVEEGPEWASPIGFSMVMDQGGDLWAGNDHGVWRLDRQAGHFIKLMDGGGPLLFSPDGRLWQKRDGGALRLLAQPGARWPDAYAHAGNRWGAIFDSDGAVWQTMDCAALVCRMQPSALPPGPQPAGTEAALATVGEVRQLSGQEARGILQDREGNIWVSTENGIDRFRRNRLLSSGLVGTGIRYSLSTDGAGNMWAADMDSNTLWRLKADRPPEAVARTPVTLVANGRQGAVLIGNKRTIERITQGRREVIPLPPGPDGKPRDHHMIGILDDGKVLWTATMETGLIGWRDGKWLPATAFTLPAKIFQSGPAGVGQLWLATGDGTLVFYDDGKLTTTDIHQLGMVTSVFLSGEPIVSGADGTGVFKDGKLTMWRAADPEVLRNVSGLVVTRDGDRWLNGAAGLVHVRAADWARSIADPAQPLRYELFGALDGYPGRAVIETRWPSAMSPDGRHLWLLATGGVVYVDTAELPRNRAVAQPAIQRVVTDRNEYPADRALRLPPGSGHFRVDFTAPLLRAPESVRFEYRLDGVDANWQDAGSRRSTSYTNVGAGDYLFRLRVFNEDGTPSENETSLRVTVEPTMEQSLWFRISCVLALVLLVFALYHYRIRQLSWRMAERLQVRVAERERIAIELHDTVLQSMHGVILHAENAVERIEGQAETRDKLVRVIEHANNAIIEGRERVQSLRHGSDDELIDLFDALVEREGAAVPVRVEQQSVSRALHLVVKDELYVVGREALRNAIRHANATQVTLTLAYAAKELVLEVRDDGDGIPADILAAGGRPGHLGMDAMRRRAEQVGGKYSVTSRPGETMVRISIPARLAYLSDAQGRTV